MTGCAGTVDTLTAQCLGPFYMVWPISSRNDALDNLRTEQMIHTD